MIVGPMTVAIWPICGPLNDSTAPHVWADVEPALPPIDGRLVPTQPAWPIWSPPPATPPTGVPNAGRPATGNVGTGNETAPGSVAAGTAEAAAMVPGNAGEAAHGAAPRSTPGRAGDGV